MSPCWWRAAKADQLRTSFKLCAATRHATAANLLESGAEALARANSKDTRDIAKGRSYSLAKLSMVLKQ